MKNKEKEWIDIFKNYYGTSPDIIAQSAGRINLIGEHTDYNEGWVLPASIDKYTTVLLSKNDKGFSSAFSLDFNQTYEFIFDTKQKHQGWESYILGVVIEMKKKGASIEHFDVLITGDVPLGAGLSSSASLECALALGLNELFSCNFSKKELAHICQMAEHHFAGVQCGIMDQFASIMGKENHCLFLDCKTLDVEYIPLDLKNYTLLLCNTNVSHSLADSEYNTRRKQCEEGVHILQKINPNINSLRDISISFLYEHKNELKDIIFQRCLYVIEENERVHQSIIALKNNNINALGQLMYKSHQGLSKKYEVSCEELDFLVDVTLDKKYILGARMMGGGFGGCTINIIQKNKINEFVQETNEKYYKRFKKEITPYIVTIGNGNYLKNLL